MLENFTKTRLMDCAKAAIDAITPDEPVRNPLHILARRDERAVLLELPHYRQIKTHTCGLVAGLIVVHYLLPRRSADAFSKRVGPSSEWGVHQRRLVQALRKTGIRVSIRSDMGFEDIAAAIGRGKPVIITLARSDEEDHWEVIGGYGRRPNRLFLWNESWFRQPARFSWREFKAKWEPIGLGLVCSKKNAR